MCEYDCWRIALKKGQLRVEYMMDYPDHYVVRTIRGADVVLFESNVCWNRVLEIVDYYYKCDL